MSEGSYINLFREEYLARKSSNPLYSLRSFAKHLDLTPAYVSFVFHGKRHLSHATAIRVAKKLKWSAKKQSYFLNLLEFENPKSSVSKENALIAIQKLESTNLHFNSLQIDTFEVISVWYYNAILTFLTIQKTKATVSLIAKKLNLNSVEVENALRRLKRLGLITQEKNYWVGIYDYLKIDSTPSDAIKIYHKQLLDKASQAIDNQNFNERDFSNMTISVDKSQLELAKKKIVEFHYEMAKLLEGKNPKEVYQLSVQLFQLSDPKGK